MAHYVSTRDSLLKADLRTALFRGLAPDGGLYMPVHRPNIQAFLSNSDPEMGFSEFAGQVLPLMFPEELAPQQAVELAESAFPFSPEMHELHERLTVLELFHGPSCAFKDFGASFLAHMMEHYLRRSDGKAVILTATSGDTGSAVARAFHNRENLEVVILYPSGRVSPLQEQQLTTLGGNVSALEVEGSFDDCQRIVKEAFSHEEAMKSFSLSSANSINLGRLLPQALYYLFAATRFRQDSDRLVFCVPSGNFGNLCAGVFAWYWGMPCERFLAATNINDVVPQYLRSGSFEPRPSVQTLSNAMDVGNPSNFERLASLFASMERPMTEMIEAEVVNDDETVQEIQRLYRHYSYFVCPHTATGTVAAERYLRRNPESRVISLSTAHPAKFVETVEQAVDVRPEIPERLAESLQLPKQAQKIGPEFEELMGFLRTRFGRDFLRSE